MTTVSISLAVARYIHNLGYNLIPCNQNKLPLVTWKHWQERSIPVAQYEEWQTNPWQISPVNWLIMTGKNPARGLPIVIVDADDQQAVDYVEENLPYTPLQTSTSRGRHFIYRRPDVDHVPCQGHVKGMKLDIKADGGLAIAPASLHNSGHVYKWSQQWTPELLASLPVYDPSWFPVPARPVATCSEEISGIDVEITEAVLQAREWLDNQTGTQANGSAGKKCLAIAIKLIHGFKLDEETGTDLLYEWGQREDQTDQYGAEYRWSYSECRHKIKSAIRVSYDNPGNCLAVTDRMLEETIKPIDIDQQSEGTASVSPKKSEPEVEKPQVDEAQYHDPELDEPGVYSAATGQPVAGKKKKVYKLYRPADLPDDDVEWQVAEHFPKCSTVTLFGPSGSGKSFYSIDLMCSIATGQKFLGKYEVIKGNCLYICSEGSYGIKRRIRVWGEAHGTGFPTDCLVSVTSHDLQDKEENQELIKRVTAELGKIDIIFIDTLSRNFGQGDTDKNQDMQKYLAAVDEIREMANCTIVNIHHTGWNEVERERGAKSLRDYSDSSICIGQKDQIIKASCKKQKEAPEFAPYQMKKILAGGSISLQLTDETELTAKPELVESPDSDLILNIPVLNGWENEAGQGVTITELQTATGKSRSTVQRALAKLVNKKSVIKIEPTGTDKQIRYVRLEKN